MIDSPELAIRDKIITSLHYKEGVFRKFFTSPFQEFKRFVGKPFIVLNQIRPLKIETDDSEAEDDMYQIQFDDGTIIDAFGHEICQLEYQKCSPKLDT